MDNPLVWKTPTMQTTEAFGECPACQKPFMGRVSWEVTMPENPTVKEEQVANLKPVGVELSHNCIPKVTR